MSTSMPKLTGAFVLSCPPHLVCLSLWCAAHCGGHCVEHEHAKLSGAFVLACPPHLASERLGTLQHQQRAIRIAAPVRQREQLAHSAARKNTAHHRPRLRNSGSMRVCVGVWVCARACASLCACACAWVHACMGVCACVRACVCVTRLQAHGHCGCVGSRVRGLRAW